MPTGRVRRGPDLPEELAAGLVEADDRAQRIEGALIEVEHVLHMPHQGGIGGRRQTPLLDQPRLYGVF